MKKTYTAALIITCITFLLLWHGYSSRQLVADKPTSINHTTKSIAVSPPNREELLQSVNRARHDAGVAPLIMDERLNQSAQVKADDMIANDYYDHVDKNGKHGYSYAREYDPDCKQAGENLVWNVQKIDITTARAMDSWLNSKPHYAAMINPAHTTTGFGIKDYVVVEHFCVQ